MSDFSDIISDMSATQAAALDVFSALSNPIRRQILIDLRQGPRSASDISNGFRQLKRPAVSEHLALLRRTGLVREEQRGRHRFYHLDPRPLADVDQWLACFSAYWDDRLRALEAVLREEHQK
jgi:DNA-binding transcriptional ArsR family regulator